MATKKTPIAPTRLKKILAEHKAKKYECPMDGTPLEYIGYEVTEKGTVLTEWKCKVGHLRHFKVVE